ncbi:MAG TPA: PHP domain-containing protein [Bacillota bacterium]|jgi:hypothetical protein
MSQLFSADIHIHTSLSPCAADDASPSRVVHRARQRGLDIIAITDHNSCENVEAAVIAGERVGLTVWPGMELQTKEEVHLLCLFPDVRAATEFQSLVYAHLPAVENRPERLGRQPLYDEQGELLGECRRLLLVSSDLGLDDAFKIVTRSGGACLPAHVDRKAYSLIGVLGAVPTGVPFPGYEVSRPQSIPAVLAACPWIHEASIVASSDAHRLEDIVSGKTSLLMAGPSLAEFVAALEGREDRKVVVRQES